MDRDSMVAASSSSNHIGLSRSSISPSVSSDTNSPKSGTHRISQDKQYAQANRIYPNHHLYHQRSETTASSTSSESKSEQSQRCRERRHHGRSKSSRTSRQSNSSNISLSQQYQLQTFMNAPSSLNWEELVLSLKRSQRSGKKIINSTIEVVEDDDVSLLDGSRSGGTSRVDRNRDMVEIQGGRSGKSLVDSDRSDDSDDSDDDQDAMDSLGSIISSPSDELQKSEEASPIHLLAQQRDSEHEESSVQDRGKELSEREITNERLRQIVARVVTDQADLDTSNPYAEQLTEKRKRFSPATTSSPTKAGNPIDESDGLVGGRDSAFDQISPTSAAVHLMSSGHTKRDGENRQSQSRANAAISRCHLPVPQDFHPLQPHPTSPSAQFEQIMIPNPISQKKRRQGIELLPHVSSRVELDDPPLWPCEDNLEADGVDVDTGISNKILSPRVTMTRRLDMQADDGSNERAQAADMERDENDSSAIEPCAFVANWEVFEARTHGEHEEEFELSPHPRKWDAFDEPDHDGGGSLINLDSSSSDSQNVDDSTVVVDDTDKLTEVAPRLSPRVATARGRSAGQRHIHHETAPFVILQRSLSINRKDPTCLQVTIHRMRRTKAEF